jgi:DNA repair protein SbcC/Rad50
MRLRRLHLKSFGPFTDKLLELGAAGQGLVLVHGPNEAGKSSALRAISDLRFGIPQQSSDNFVHSYSDMRIGGEFVDRHGAKYSFIRRKGRNATLQFADINLIEPISEKPVPPEVEALVTCGLTKESYDSMFGLDHRRLREGGQALLKGEGDIGAALFEASAGVRSIPDVVERLEASARRFFMPGARGKNARINESLAAYEARHAELRQAQVRPAQWAELYKEEQATARKVAELEVRRLHVSGKLLLIKELRAVAPLLSTFDNAARILGELKSATLLSTTAPAERAAAESGLSDALHNGSVASEAFKQQTQRLDELKLDTAILTVSTAAKRLAASSEAIDQHRRDIADAQTDVAAEDAQVSALAGRVAPGARVDEVLKRVPSKAERALIEKRLREVEGAQQALDHHLKAAVQDGKVEDPELKDLPSAELRTSLRIAQSEVTRSDAALKRLSALPSEIKAAQRAVDQALTAIGLPDEAAVQRVRPLLDAQIDTALQEENENRTHRAGFATRINEIEKGLSDFDVERGRLLAQGAVPTREEVDAARLHRDSGWTLIRGVYINATSPATGDYGGGIPLPQAYEQAVVRADRLVDELAGDQKRAAQLQAANTAIRTLEKDRDTLVQSIDRVDRTETDRLRRWKEVLIAAGLPFYPPAGLRDWQALLSGARHSLETLQAKRDELEQVRGVEQSLATQLRRAILAMGLAKPSEDATLGMLSAMAVEVTEMIRQREEAIQKAIGKEAERKLQRQKWISRETQLKEALETALQVARTVSSNLLLPETSNVQVSRTRLLDFEELENAAARQTAARIKQHRAEQALAVLVTAAKAVWESLGETEPSDLRFYGECLAGRLVAAEAVQRERALAQQAADSALTSQRNHETTAARYRKVLAELCRAAGVESETLLPEAEERSRRRRETQDAVDKSRVQLAAASRRSIDDLRALLAGQEAAQMDADELAHERELSEIDKELPQARERKEQARRDLDAIDASDTAATAREAMEQAASSVRAQMSPWIRSKIAHALLAEALRRFRERAQGPMLVAASGYFEKMTRGEFVRLISDDSGKEPVLIAQRRQGARIRVEEMSEGTRDQLYLALRLAALDVRRAAGIDLPVVLDDVLMASDEERSGAMLEALADFGRDNQVIVFTHHRHIAEMAQQRIPPAKLALVQL